MKNKIMALLVALVMLCSAMPLVALAEEALAPASLAQEAQVNSIPAAEDTAAEDTNQAAAPDPAEAVGQDNQPVFSCVLGSNTACTIPDTTAENEPTYYSAQGIFLANGHAVTVEERDSKTWIRWEGGEVEVPNTVTVFGGCHNHTEACNAEITMVSGTVKNIVGGGLHRSNVANALVKMQGGTVTGGLQGGGGSLFTGGESYTRAQWDADKTGGVCRTDKAVIEITGGTVTNVFGGGESYAYVGEAVIRMTGGSCTELIGGGSNGYTGTATISVGGSAQITGYLHTVNRGAVNVAQIELLPGSTVKDLYYGWNSGDQSGSNTTIENGGGVRQSLLVTYGGGAVSGAVDKAAGLYENAKITEVKNDKVIPDRPTEDTIAAKQEAVNNAIKAAVKNDQIKSGATIVSTTLQSQDAAVTTLRDALLSHSVLSLPEIGFAELIQSDATVGTDRVTLVLSKDLASITLNGEGKLTALLYDVAPIKIDSGSGVAVVTRLGNLSGAISFKLPLPTDWPTPYASLKHQHDGKVSSSELNVKTTQGGEKYVEITSARFSSFELSPLAALTPAPTSAPSQNTPAPTTAPKTLDATPKTGPAMLPMLVLLAAVLLACAGLASRKKWFDR